MWTNVIKPDGPEVTNNMAYKSDLHAR